MDAESMESYSYNHMEKYSQADMDKKDARIKELEEGLINIRGIAENNITICGTCHTVLEFIAIHHRDLEGGGFATNAKEVIADCQALGDELSKTAKSLSGGEKLTPWKPINTAPKDGTEILTYSEKYGVKQLCWQVINYPEGSWGDKLPKDKQGAWVRLHDDPHKMGCFNPTDWITHWMECPVFSLGDSDGGEK
jgi:hypothetical protein